MSYLFEDPLLSFVVRAGQLVYLHVAAFLRAVSGCIEAELGIIERYMIVASETVVLASCLEELSGDSRL